MEDRGSAKNDQKQLKVKQSRQLECTCGLFPAKAGTKRFRPMAGLVACVFYLILECTCFWPQTDKVYLFLAAAPFSRCALNACTACCIFLYTLGKLSFIWNIRSIRIYLMNLIFFWRLVGNY